MARICWIHFSRVRQSMRCRVHPSIRFATIATVAVAALLAMASSALGASVPTGVASIPPSPNNAASWQFTWGASDPAVPGNEVTYQGAVVTASVPEPAPAAMVSGVSLPIPDDAVAFRVQSVELGSPSEYAVLPIEVDRSAPTATGVDLNGPSGGVNNWFRSPLTAEPTGCSDNGGAGGGCGVQSWTTEGRFAAGAASITLTDSLGNSRTVAIPAAFGYDATKPKGAPDGQPTGTGTLVGEEPTFEWTPGADAGSAAVASGVARYEVHFRTIEAGLDDPGFFGVIAKRDDLGGVGNYKATRDPDLRPTPLPTNTASEWRVRTIDRAGNVKDSAWRDLTIDPTIPPAPTITGGPSAPTRDNAPTFTWTGTQSTFRWDVTLVGAQNPARQGGGKDVTQTTLSPLADGDYTFRVTQITEAGQGSAEATRTFKVDTTPPPPPTIVTRPTFPAIGAAPLFAWTGEPGAYSRWSIVDAAGNLVYGPIDTPVTSAELPSLGNGTYFFQVGQIDPAGNISPAASEPFTVLAPLVAPPTTNARTAFLAALPKQNALRLKPRAGTTLPTLRPVLRWKKGPRGTKLYNLQIFQVTARKDSNKPKVTKVLSRFPRGLQFRPPAKNLKADTCYVWRVWPYTGTAFTTRPVGVSNFCVAEMKVIRSKAAKAAAARRAAQLRAARRGS